VRISLSLGGISSLILGWGASLSHDPVVGEFLVLECVVVVSSNLKFWCKQEQVVVRSSGSKGSTKWCLVESKIEASEVSNVSGK